MAKIVQLVVSTGAEEDGVYAVMDSGEVWFGVLKPVDRGGRSTFEWLTKLPPVPVGDVDASR